MSKKLSFKGLEIAPEKRVRRKYISGPDKKAIKRPPAIYSNKTQEDYITHILNTPLPKADKKEKQRARK